MRRLVLAGILDQPPSAVDRRLVEIGLTGKGFDLYRQIAAIARAFEADLPAAISDQERRALQQSFETLHGWLDAGPRAPPRSSRDLPDPEAP